MGKQRMQISARFKAASVYMFQFGQYTTNVKSLPPNLPLIQKAQVQISIRRASTLMFFWLTPAAPRIFVIRFY
jgi:hypothetical protein